MDISLINLDRCTEKLARFHQFNSHLSAVSRVPAVDGRTLSRAQLIERKIMAEDIPGYTNGALGCALSHFAQWERAVREQKTLNIAEDDAVFHRDFERHAPAILAALPPDWDIILWGWNFDSILFFDLIPGVSPAVATFDQKNLRASLDKFQHSPLFPHPYRLYRAFGTVAYSVTPAGAEKLHRHCVPIRPFEVYYPGLNRSLPNSEVDHMTNDAYPITNAFVCFPPLVVTENDHAQSATVTNS